MTVVTRFAPSPTGFLHIGGARTALFNWLFAKHHGGQYVLRIEDTDRKRSTPEAIDAILDGLNWLGLEHDGEVVFQFSRAERHREVVEKLLSEGKAYRCYCSPEELEAMREQAKAEGKPMRYNGMWRDRDQSEAPSDIQPAIRIKMPQTGETTIKDLVQGEVTVAHEQLDDFILLRADGTPTYMCSVVVDDHDMGITHIIRGDDHLNNAFRQFHFFKACGWDVPEFAHIPLIHGSDGAKLSKRHGALGVDAYRDMGYVPEAVCNYLLRLGWSHGDEEIISREQAIEWFDVDAIGKSASRFDFTKLENVNGIYMRDASNDRLVELIRPKFDDNLSDANISRLHKGMDSLKQRAKNINELADSARFYVTRPTFPLENAKAQKLLNEQNIITLSKLSHFLDEIEQFDAVKLEDALRTFAETHDLGLGKVMQPLRSALTGSNASPSLFEVMEIFGKTETIQRIQAVPGLS